MSPSGAEAILDLADGDMRRVMNLLQATAMAYGKVDEASVYLTSGSPMPKDMEEIAEKLMNETMLVAVTFLREKVRRRRKGRT